MKVMCVNHDYFEGEERRYRLGDPEIGDVCTLLNSFPYNNRTVYSLAEFTEAYYDSRNFAPLSEIDELELVNEKMETA